MLQQVVSIKPNSEVCLDGRCASTRTAGPRPQTSPELSGTGSHPTVKVGQETKQEQQESKKRILDLSALRRNT
jgi:hypothetical protein